MSVKRQASTELNRDNWDEEDPAEDKGHITIASKEVIEKRVIRTARRRNPISREQSVFSGFGGFNKTQPSSFDFLANLTNGSKKNTNGSSSTSSSETVTSSLFTNKQTSPSGGLFEIPASSTPSKPPQSSALISTTSPFGAAVKTSPSSLFTATKADSTVKETPFKMQSVSSSVDSNIEKSPLAQNSINVFGVSSTSASENKTLFSSTNSTPFKIQPVSTTTAGTGQVSLGISTSTTTAPVTTEKKSEDKSNNEKKTKYYSKLKGLNESVSEWINQHVAKTPICILSPIFADYEKYLAEIIKEYQGGENEGSDKTPTDDKAPETKTENVSETKTTPFGLNNTNQSPINSSPFNAAPKPSIFSTDNNLTSSSENKQPTFSYGIKTPTNITANATTTNSGFSFGVSTPSMASPTSSPFSLTTNATSSQSGSTPFSFGIGKPFSFSSNNVSQPNPEPANENEEEEPPKVEYTPVKEDNSVYEKKCKIFVKKDGNFADKGVGTLYVKKIEESGKHQLLVRANTNLGTILLNLVLAEAIPTQRMGKNNVMLVCIPTPDAKPPPTTVLIRVKTLEEADELLETLNKYKA